jgi:hypothetical protein
MHNAMHLFMSAHLFNKMKLKTKFVMLGPTKNRFGNQAETCCITF